MRGRRRSWAWRPEALADWVAVIAAGTIVAEGPPGRLGGRDTAQADIRFVLPPGVRAGDLPLDDALVRGDGQVRIATQAPQAALWILLSWARERGVELPGLEVVRPSLEQVYLELVSKA
jgi:ABC-2 type transport system ATP-binding protein